MSEGFGFSYLKMLFSDLDILHEHVRKISALKKLILALAGQEPSSKCVISKIREQIVVLHGLLNKMESDYQENNKKTTLLKELQDTAEKEQKEAQHFLEVLPHSFHYWSSCDSGQTLKRDEMQLRTETECTEASGKSEFPSNTSEVIGENVQQVPSDFGKIKKRAERQLGKETKHGKAFDLTVLLKEISAVTSEDLEEIPSYMKGRITCDQVNAVVKNLNKAMMTKYRIRSQPLKSMNTAERELYYRYIREEHENNEGACFVVEDDIKLFTHMKMDKRFHQIITILRHCQRLKEIRTSGVVRYATW